MVVIIVGAVYLATLDGSYDIVRTRTVEADPTVVFNDLNDFKNWKEWGPWYEQDSTLRVQYDNNTIGEGGAYSWTSDIEGGGRMTTLKVLKPERLDQEIIFETPFGDMKSEVYWILKKAKTGTEVTWGIKGEMPFFTRFMASGMEEQLGPMQERGLELFDKNIEKKLKIFAVDSIGVVDYSGGFYLYLSTSSKINQMTPKLNDMMREIQDYMGTHNIRSTGSPYTIFHKFDSENGTTLFSVAIPIADRVITKDSNILTGYMDRATYFKTVLTGAYVNLKGAWEQAMFNASNLKDHHVVDDGEPFEIYVNNTLNTVNPADLVTEIYVPVQIK